MSNDDAATYPIDAVNRVSENSAGRTMRTVDGTTVYEDELESLRTIRQIVLS
jgi:hypothetical protein